MAEEATHHTTKECGTEQIAETGAKCGKHTAERETTWKTEQRTCQEVEENRSRNGERLLHKVE
jgi:hypothetical protein